MEEWLRAKLLVTAAVTDLVVDRIDWNLRPQGDGLAAIALHLISNLPERKMTGNPTWWDARVQVDCWGGTPGETILLRRAVVTLCEGLRDLVAEKKYRVFVIDTDGKPASDRDASRIDHRAQVDLRVSYQP